MVDRSRKVPFDSCLAAKVQAARRKVQAVRFPHRLGVSRLAPATTAAATTPITNAAPSPCRIALLCALMSAPLNRICNGWPTSDFVRAIEMPNTMKVMANAPKSDAVVERATTIDSTVLLSADKA